MPTPPDVNEIAKRLDRIQELADELAKCPRETLDQMDTASRLHREIVAARQALKPEP